jgi:hypothetical protein
MLLTCMYNFFLEETKIQVQLMKLIYKNQDLRGKQLYHLFIIPPLYKFNYTSGSTQAVTEIYIS